MRILVFILLLLSSFISSAQCPNANFELNNFSNWIGTTGSCCPINLQNTGIVNGRHTIMSGTGTDPRTCNNVTVVAPGGLFSARLGNSNIGAEAEGLSYTFFVTPQSTLITYQYAVVFEDPGHTIDEQPRFQSRVLLQNGDTIPCTEFSVTAASDIPGFQTCNGIDNQGNPIAVSYKNWTTVGVDVSAYIGQNVTLQFQTGDCSLGGHFGYAYVDAKCGPLELTVDYCSGSDSAVVTAPTGFFTYLWSTGDTTQSIIVDPLVISNLNCTITSISGCQATLNTILTPTIINPSFTYSNNCVGTINFTNTSTITNGTIISSLWTFGDNTSTQNSLNGIHTYTSPGNYLVTLTTISDNGCANSTAQYITVYPNPVASFTHNYVCLGDEVNFTSQSTTSLGYNINSWEWLFGDSYSSTGEATSHLYNNTGNYNVSLIVTTANSQCRDTVSQVVTILNTPTANFSAIDVCQGTPMSFSDQSLLTNWANNVNYLWNFDYQGSTSLLQNPVFTYPFSGSYNVSLIVQNSTSLYTCRDTITIPVNVYPNPVIDFEFEDACLADTIQFTNLSSGDVLNYVWGFGDNSYTNIVNPKKKYQFPGIYEVFLTGVSSNFCRDTVRQTINVFPGAVVSFTEDLRRGCVPLTINFTDNTEANTIAWLWNFGDGTYSTNQNVSHTYTTVGTFDVTLQVTTAEGCVTNNVQENLIQTYPTPNAYFTYLPQFLTDTSSLVYFYNSSSGGSIYTWNFDDGTFDYVFNPVHQYPDSGLFHTVLTVENLYGCSDEYAVDIFVKATFGFFVPTGFTPNGNNKNDVWFPVFRNVKDFKCYVFNRWGELIFTGSINNSAWDGTYKGTQVQNDVYVYKFDVIDLYDEYHAIIGRVTIIK